MKQANELSAIPIQINRLLENLLNPPVNLAKLMKGCADLMRLLPETYEGDIEALTRGVNWENRPKQLFAFYAFLQQLDSDEFNQYKNQFELLRKIFDNGVLPLYINNPRFIPRIQKEIRSEFAPIFQQATHTTGLIGQIEDAVKNRSTIDLPTNVPISQLDTSLSGLLDNWTGFNASSSIKVLQCIECSYGTIANFQNRDGRKGENQDAAVLMALSDEAIYSQKNTQFSNRADFGKILANTYRQLDRRFDQHLFSGGTTAATNLLVNNQLFTATLADAASFLVAYDNAGQVMRVKRLNEVTHKPTWSEERNRIEANGGFIRNGRVNGQLAVSRAIGDNDQRDVIAEPSIDVLDLAEFGDSAKLQLLVCSDGFTDQFGSNFATSSDEKAAQEQGLSELLKTFNLENKTETEVAQLLMNATQNNPRTGDDTTLVVTPLNPSASTMLVGVYDGHGHDGGLIATEVATSIADVFVNQSRLEAAQSHQYDELNNEERLAFREWLVNLHKNEGFTTLNQILAAQSPAALHRLNNSMNVIVSRYPGHDDINSYRALQRLTHSPQPIVSPPVQTIPDSVVPAKAETNAQHSQNALLGIDPQRHRDDDKLPLQIQPEVVKAAQSNALPQILTQILTHLPTTLPGLANACADLIRLFPDTDAADADALICGIDWDNYPKALYAFDAFLQQLDSNEFTQYKKQFELLRKILSERVLNIFITHPRYIPRIKTEIRSKFVPIFQQLTYMTGLIGQIEDTVKNQSNIDLTMKIPTNQLGMTLSSPWKNWTGLDASFSTITPQYIEFPHGSIANFQNSDGREVGNQDSAMLVELGHEEIYGQNNTHFADQANYVQILASTYHQLDLRFNPILYSGGTTAATNLLVNNQLFTATLADASSFLIAYNQDGEVMTVTRLNQVTHKPAWSEERSRIEASDGFIMNGRVNGQLAVSRAIGDNNHRGVIAEPSIDVLDLNAFSDSAKLQLLVCSNGFTDQFGSNFATSTDEKIAQEQGLLKLLKTLNLENKTETEVAELLLNAAQNDPTTYDDTTLILTTLEPTANMRLFGVYDGHGPDGGLIATEVAKTITDVLIDQSRLEAAQRNQYDRLNNEERIAFREWLVNLYTNQGFGTLNNILAAQSPSALRRLERSWKTLVTQYPDDIRTKTNKSLEQLTYDVYKKSMSSPSSRVGFYQSARQDSVPPQQETPPTKGPGIG